jgi:hypothetical protein
MRTHELGTLPIDEDIVCFSAGNVQRLADRLGISQDTLISRYNGVQCELGSDSEGNYGIDAVTAIDEDGRTYPAVVIGVDVDKFKRFLRQDELTFKEFYEKHPRHQDVGSGENFNLQVFEEIVQEYKVSVIVP